MAKFKEKNIAIKLRKKGESISEIAQKINVSKSIISRWCRDIRLTKNQIERLNKKMADGSYKGRMIFLERIREKRKQETIKLKNEGIKEIGGINKRDILIAGTALYWAEGTRSLNAEETSFSNSSPKMILWMLDWFKVIFGVSKDRFTIQIRINKIHEHRVKEVKHYWSKITKIPIGQFTKTILIKTNSKKVYTNNKHYGTVRITIRKGTGIRRKIIGLIEGLAKYSI